MNYSIHERTADNIRILSAAMVEKANSGHPGGAMGGADYIHILYSEFLRYDPDDTRWFFRDRFFLDPGHMSPMLYAMLTLLGIYTLEDLKSFRQWGSPTHGHPELSVLRGIENTSGPLGMGHALALGSAVAERFIASRFGEWTAHKTYAYISDGGIQEEISQGVGRIAGHLGLANFIMYFDSNDIQLSHATSSATSEDTAGKYEAWGWRVETIDGHDHERIRAALTRAHEEKEKPTLIIGKTIMGKGALDEKGNPFERKCSTHGMPLSKAGASFQKTVANLGGDPENPFAVFDDVGKYYSGVVEKKRAAARKEKENYDKWEKQYPELARKLRSILNGQAPSLDFSQIRNKPNVATRVASGEVLAMLAQKLPNMIVSSADLSNSDNTGRFLDKTGELKNNDFSGAFLQAGVSELTMGAVCIGIALHGGVISACGTFFVFSDYMKPAVRLAALMGIPVKFIWTHDSFRVGEDGPTHQPVEQETQVRLLEKMKNLEGKRSILVLRPADAAETVVAWKMALENTNTPTALILSRQAVGDVPGSTDISRYADALEAQKGAYIVFESARVTKPDIILLGNGSEVSLLVESAKVLSAEKKLNVRVVSAISEGLFNEQPGEYQKKTLPFAVPKFALTAGLPDVFKNMAGPWGKVYGLERFGASAPYQVLDQKFGFTVENVTALVKQYLEEYKMNIDKMKQAWV